MQFNFELVDPAELVGFARGLEYADLTLEAVLPNQEVEDIEYRFMKGRVNDADSAEVRTWDTEAPIADRQGVSRVSGELPPISSKIQLGEEALHRLRRLQQGTEGASRQQIDAIYDDVSSRIRSVQVRVERFRGEAIAQAQLVINENGVVATVDYGRTGTHSVAPGTLWSNAAATIVADERTWRSTYIDTNGFAPGAQLTSDKVIGNMLLNTELRTLAGSLLGTPSVVIDPTLVSRVFAANSFAPIVEYNTLVRVGGVRQRVIASDLVIFLPPAEEQLGKTLYGVTAEATVLADKGFIERTEAPGVVAVVLDESEPVSTWTKAAGIALPVVGNPDFTLKADVQ